MQFCRIHKIKINKYHAYIYPAQNKNMYVTETLPASWYMVWYKTSNIS
jgi:hypothetical protein